MQTITGSLQVTTDETLIALDLRRRIREHPLSALGVAAVMGFLAGPELLRACKRVLKAGVALGPAAARGGLGLPGVVRASLEAVRARS